MMDDSGYNLLVVVCVVLCTETRYNFFHSILSRLPGPSNQWYRALWVPPMARHAGPHQPLSAVRVPGATDRTECVWPALYCRVCGPQEIHSHWAWPQCGDVYHQGEERMSLILRPDVYPIQTHPQYGGCSDNDYMYGSLTLCCTLDIPSLIPSLSQLGTRLSLLGKRLFLLGTRLGYPTIVSITVSCL